MANVKSIVRLHSLGRSHRRIAEELGVHRETVARYVSRAESAASEAPTGSEEPPDVSKPATSAPRVEGSKPANAPHGSGGARSECEPHRDRILELLELGLSVRASFRT